jgi:filamentous hemagglutinin family protein
MRTPARTRRSGLQPLALALGLALAYPVAQGLPQGAQVVQGQAKVSTPQPGQGLIQQGSDKAVINWQSFSIGANEGLRIEQPSVNSVLLNRVVGGDPSLILGRMQSNGQVFLLNPRGIVFGRGSQVDTGGLVASTLDLSDSAFLAGNYRFTAGPGAAGLQADGSISAPNGTVALLAPQLNVGGSIQARRVGLAAASSVTVDVEGDGLVLFNLRNDDNRDVALKFSGQVLADGGSAELRAQARAGAAGQVLNMDGLVQARGLRQQGGRIVIDGGTAGDTLVTGKLDASSGQQGGSITVLGQRVALLDAARLDASGLYGGGSLQVGGGFQGQGTGHNAEYTWIASGAELRADATEKGDGGGVAVWADKRTDMFGSIWARGGRLGGDGGSVETSGRQQLNMPTGSVDVSAPLGRAGQWLLDPNNLTISNGSTQNLVDPNNPPFVTSDDSARLNIGTLNGALTGGATVVVRTDSAGNDGQTGNISVTSNIVPAGSATLNLIAQGSITFSGQGKITAGSSHVLNVSLLAGSDATGANAGSNASTITGTSIDTNGGTLTATAKNAIDLGTVSSAALNITSTAGNVVLPTGTVSGALTVSASGIISQTGGGLVVTGTSGLIAGAAAITLTDSANNFQGAVSLTGTTAQISNRLNTGEALTLGTLSLTGDLTATARGGTLNLGTGTVGGNVTATSNGGAITQTAGGLVIGGTSTLNAGSAAITLTDAANDFQSTVNLTGGTTQVVSTKTATSALTLGTVSTGALTATAGGGALNLGTGTVTGALTATSGGGAISQAAGGLAVTGNASINAGSAAITLNDAANDWGGSVALTGGTTQITSTASASSTLTLGAITTGALTASTGGGALTLGTGTVTGALSATSGGGSITQATGGLTVTSTSTLNAGAGNITLSDGTNNHLNGDVTLTGNAVDVRSAGNLSVVSLTQPANQSLTLYSGGVLTLPAGLTDIDTGTADLSLTSLGGSFAPAGKFSGTNITVAAGTGLSLGFDITATGTLNLSTGSGGVTQTAGTILATGATTVAAGASTINLAQSGNHFQSAVSLTGGNTIILDSAALTLGTLATGDLTVTSSGALGLGTGTVTGNLSAVSNGGAITQASGGLVVTGTSTLNAGAAAITLADAANDFQNTVNLTGGTTQIASTKTATSLLTLGTVSTGALTATSGGGALNLGTGTVGGALNATSGGGAITQASGGLVVTGTATLNAGSGAITLADAANDLQATVNLSGGTTQIVNTKNASEALTLGTVATGALTVTAGGGALNLGTGSVTGNLSATSGGGAISQASGGLVVTGTASLDAGSAAITLADAANSLQGVVSLTGSTAQVTSTKNAGDALALGSLSITGDLTATAGGGTLTLGTGTVGGNLTATSGGGAILQAAGGLTVSGTGTTALNAGSAAITLADAANDLHGTINVTGGATQIANTKNAVEGLTLGTVSTGNLSVAANGGALKLGTGTVTGTLTAVSGGGAISQAAGGLVVTGNASLDAGSTAAITLNDAANDWGGSVSLTGGATQLTSTRTATSTLSLGTLSTGALTVSTNGGALTLGTGTVGGTLSATTGGGALGQVAGGITVSGNATLDAGTTGDVTLSDSNNHWNGGVTLTGNSLDLRSAGNLTLLGVTQPANRSLTLSAGGNLSLVAADIDTGTGDLSLTSLGGSFTAGGKLAGHDIALAAATGLSLGHDVTASGTLGLSTLSGGVTQTAGAILATGATTVAAGTSAISLAQTGNHFQGAVSLTGGATTLVDSGALTLGTLATGALTVTSTGVLGLGTGTVGGNLSATSNGFPISQAGPLTQTGTTVTLNAGTAPITLTDPGNILIGAITATGGAVSLLSSTNLDLTALTQSANQALVLNAGGTLTLPAGLTNIDTGTAPLTLSSLGGAFTTAGTLKGGDVTLRGLSVTLGHDITASGVLDVQSTNGPINQTAGRISAKGLSLFDAGTKPISLNNTLNDFLGPVILSGGATQIYDLGALNLVSLNTADLQVQSNGLLNLGTGTVSGNLVAASGGGAITQSLGGLSVTGSTSLNAGAAAITLLDAANSWTGAVGLTGGITQLNGVGAVKLGAGNVSSLTLTAGGAVSQAAALIDNGALNVNAGVSAIDLSNTGNALNGIVTLTGGATQVHSAGALTLGTLGTADLTASSSGPLNLGQGLVAGNLVASSGGGAISQAAGGLVVTGNASLNAGSAAITLNNVANDWGGTVAITGGATQLTSTRTVASQLVLGALSTGDLTVSTAGGALTLGTGTVNGALSANSNGGTLDQAAGGITVSGVATLNAGAGNVALNDPGNHWNGGVQLTGNSLDLRSAGNLSILSLSQPANRPLTLSAGGNLSLVATDIDTGTADLSLTSLGGSFTAGGKLAGHNIALAALTGLSLGHDVTASGTLDLSTTGGGVTQTAGAITVFGATTVAAGASAISLNQAGNNFLGPVSLTGATTAIADSSALTLGTLATGNLAVTSSGALDLGQGSVTGSLSATSNGGAITQAAGGLTVTGPVTLNAGAGSITLASAANDLRGTVSLTGGATQVFNTKNAGEALTLGVLNTGSLAVMSGGGALTLGTGTVGGTLAAISNGGAITQAAGGLVVTGPSNLNAGTAAITLADAANNLQGAVSLTGGTTQIVNTRNAAEALTLGSVNTGALTVTAGGGTLNLGTGAVTGNLVASSGGGAITQAVGGLAVTGSTSLNAGVAAITLLDSANSWTGAVALTGGVSQLNGVGAVKLGTSTVSSLTLTASGAVSQAGALIDNGALNVNAGVSAIDLSNAGNALGGIVSLTGGAAQVRTVGTLAMGTLNVGDLTVHSSGILNLGQGGVAGNLVADSGGSAIAQTGALAVAGTAGIQAGAGAITLTQAGNAWGGAVSLTGSTTQIRSGASLSLGTLAVGALTATSSGALGLGQGTIGGSLTATSNGGAVTQAGALDVAGPANVQAGAGSITLTQAANVWHGPVQLGGGATQIAGTGALTLGALGTGSLSATSTGPLNLGQGVIGGTLVANSGGNAVTQTGALQVNSSATVNAGGADITLTNSGNQLLGTLTLTGNAVALYNQPSLTLANFSFNSLDATSNGSVTLGSGSLSGSLAVKALGGTIMQTPGGLGVAGTTTLQASGGISLTDAANHLQGLVNLNSTGPVALANAADLKLGTVSTGALALNVGGALDLGTGSVGGNLAATTTGAITQTGALSVAGTTTLDAGSAAVSLNQVGNNFAGTVNLAGGATQFTSSTALSLGGLATGNLTVSSGGALQLGTGTVAGTLQASSSGPITQAAGGLAVSGTTSLDAASNAIQLTDTGNAFTGAVNLLGGDVSLANGTALHLGSLTVHDLALSAAGSIDLGTGTVNGNLSATTKGTAVTQTGPLTVKGTSSFIADGSAASLVLDQVGNQLLGAVSTGGINGGHFAGIDLLNSLDLSVGGDVQNLSLQTTGLLTLTGGHFTTLTVSAGTGIVQTGAVDVSGTTTLIAKGATPLSVDLSQAGNDLTRVQLTTQSGGSFGRVQLRDGDATRHDGLQVLGNAAALEATSAGALDLGGGSYASLLADTSGTGAAITQSGALAVSGLATFKAGSGAITLTRVDNSLPSLTVASAGDARFASAGNVTVNASDVSTRLDLASPGAINLQGPLTGAGELVVSGTGSLTINSAQGYSGGTRIQAGSLVLQGPGAQAGSGAVQLGAAGQLDLRDGATLTNALVGQGGTVLNSSGTGTLSGAVTLLALTPFMPSASAGGLTVSGNIGGSFGLSLNSAGTLTLSGNNSFSGATDIAAGTLRVNSTGALSPASAVQLSSGAVLALGVDQSAGSFSGTGRIDLGSYTLGIGADGRDGTFGGSLSGSGGLTKLGAGTFTFTGSGTQTGATRVAAGRLVLASGSSLNDSTAMTVDAGATLTLQQSVNLGSLAGAGSVEVQAPLLSVGGNGASTSFDGVLSGSGGLAKLGSGRFTLAGANTLAGDVQVNAGSLALSGTLPANAAVAVAGGATLELLSDQALGALTGSGQVLLNPYALTLGATGRDGRFDGVIGGAGSLVKAGNGTVALGGVNVYTGGTRVSGGTLNLAVAQAIGGALVIDSSGRVQVNARQVVGTLSGTGALELDGATLAVGTGGSDSRFDGVVGGTGGLTKQGAGTLTLTAAGANSGVTVIEAGTVKLTGDGSLGSGEIQNQGTLSLDRSAALTLSQAITGSGSLAIQQGQVTLANGGNSYTGATQVLGGSLVTTAAERLPDASAVTVAAGAQLQLGGSETIGSLQAAGSVHLVADLTTKGDQTYTGSLVLANPAGITLSGANIDASHSSNQFAGTPLGLNGGQALVTVKETLQLGNVTLSSGGHIEADRLEVNGKLQLTGGSLALIANAAPDDAKAVQQGIAQTPLVGASLAAAEATVQEGASGAITVADGAKLQVQAVGGGSVLLGQDANSFKGQLAVLSGAKYDTAWQPNVKGGFGIQSLVRVAGSQVLVGGNGIEGDMLSIRADNLATATGAKLVARLPFDETLLGKTLSAPSLTLELAPGAIGSAGSFGSFGTGGAIQVEVGALKTGGRTSGPNAGYVTVLPKGGAQGTTVIVLEGPEIGGVPPYRFFHDGARQATEIPVVYNGVLPLTPSASGALSSINGDAEDARRARFQETVRTENVTVRLRAGVIAEVGPGRAATQGSDGATPPVQCDPTPPLGCKPASKP